MHSLDSKDNSKKWSFLNYYLNLGVAEPITATHTHSGAIVTDDLKITPLLLASSEEWQVLSKNRHSFSILWACRSFSFGKI